MQERTMRLRILFTAALVLTLSACPMASAAATVSAAGLKEARQQKSAIEAERKKVQDTLKGLESLKSDTVAYVRELDASLDALNEELETLELQTEIKNSQILDSESRLQEAETVEADQYASMKLRIRYMYEKGEVSYLDLLFQSADIEELLNRAEYVAKITEYDRNMLHAYEEAVAAVEAEKAALEQEKQELQTLTEETEARQESVETLLAEKNAQLASYEDRIASAQNQINSYDQELKNQEAKIASIEAAVKKQEEEARKAAEAAKKKTSVQSLGSISFTWPVPSSGRITSAFGKRTSPTAGASTSHQGIDIGASSGSAIVAAAGGEVVISTYSASAGNYIMIHHGGGVYTVYMHCSKLLVSVGSQVKKGQTIAKVGSTGRSTGPHLHFGIRSGGNYVNPSKYVSP